MQQVATLRWDLRGVCALADAYPFSVGLQESDSSTLCNDDLPQHVRASSGMWRDETLLLSAGSKHQRDVEYAV